MDSDWRWHFPIDQWGILHPAISVLVPSLKSLVRSIIVLRMTPGKTLHGLMMNITPLKTNGLHPENGWLEDWLSLGWPIFRCDPLFKYASLWHVFNLGRNRRDFFHQLYHWFEATRSTKSWLSQSMGIRNLGRFWMTFRSHSLQKVLEYRHWN